MRTQGFRPGLGVGRAYGAGCRVIGRPVPLEGGRRQREDFEFEISDFKCGKGKGAGGTPAVRTAKRTMSGWAARIDDYVVLLRWDRRH